MTEDAQARLELALGREALARGDPERALEAVEASRRRPFAALSATTHREVGTLARELLRPGYDAARALLAHLRFAEAEHLEARLAALLPGDREHESLRVAHAAARVRALLDAALVALAAQDLPQALQRARQLLRAADTAPADLRAELDALGAELARAAIPRLSAQARGGELNAANLLARTLSALPVAWFTGLEVQTADAFERLARKLMETALGKVDDDLPAAGALARACGELRPPVRLSAAFAEERSAFRELYGERALAAAEAAVIAPGAGVEAARACHVVVSPVDWRRVRPDLRERCRLVLAGARGLARAEIARALESAGPGVRAACALQLLEVAGVQHRASRYLADARARDEAELERLTSLDLAREALGLGVEEAEGRAVSEVERELEQHARRVLDDAIAAGAREDEARGASVPLAALLKSQQVLDQALAVEEGSFT